MKRTLLILGVAALLVAGATIPALARDGVAEVERARQARTFPPGWVDMSADELRAEVGERTARAIGRIEDSRLMSEERKAELIAVADSLTAAVADADFKAEIVGLSISRVQLQRAELRAERRGVTFDGDAHIAGDADRAERRLERLTKVTAWAEAAGEDVAAIGDYLDAAAALLDESYGDGTVEDRHDAVHISLAWLVQAAAGLDRL
jgi:hypothetical protein